jgi:hypothetical protein
MTVREFILFLRAQPQDIQVAHKMFSEYCLLDKENIRIEELKKPRDDGWIHCDWRDEGDVPKQKYLMLPGN